MRSGISLQGFAARDLVLAPHSVHFFGVCFRNGFFSHVGDSLVSLDVVDRGSSHDCSLGAILFQVLVRCFWFFVVSEKA